MDWLSEKKFVFISSVTECSNNNLFLQIFLIIAAAFMGALASHLFARREANRARKVRLNSLAISTLRKLSNAHSASYSFDKSFFYNIKETTNEKDYWIQVKAMPRMEINKSDLTDEEFEFLLRAENGDDIAHRFSELIHAVNINISVLNTYADYKQTLNGMLAQHPNLIASDGKLKLQTIRTSHPDIAIKIYEANDLCVQAYRANQSAIELGEGVKNSINEILPALTENPDFGQRLISDID